MNIIKSFKNLSKFETFLWISSLIGVIITGIWGKSGTFQTISSAIGVTALIFVAKGDVLGQLLTVIFSVLYGIISFSFAYYGEMITYLGMTAPIAALAVISWLRHPFEKGRQEVAVNSIKKAETVLLALITAAVTAIFYFVLNYFNTANIIPSTLSVTTSFLASYLTFRRSRFYALFYAANDIVLISLWILASIEDISYLPMIICFLMFFLNDTYGFFYWSRMKKRQENQNMLQSQLNRHKNTD